MDEPYVGVEIPKEPDVDDTDKSILKTAQDRLKVIVDANIEERAKQLDDLRFSTLEQWPDEIRKARENDVNGARPCLTIDKINQYITQVVNDFRQHRPGIKPRPVDDNADVETAKVFAGVIRHIEENSNASIAYETAVESAVRTGEGYFRFVTEYEDEKSFNKVIKFKHIPNTFSVYLGPHLMPDGSDCDHGFVLEDIALERFKREYPKAKYDSASFEGVDPDWRSEDTVRVAEYFYTDFEDEKLLFLSDGRTMTEVEYEAVPDDGFKPEIVKGRQTQTKKIKWRKLTGVEVLEKEDWDGKYIPIVKVIGRELWVDGKRRCWGLVRPAKDSLRMYNYWASTITEKLALSPKTPFIGAVGQFATQADKWDKANTMSYSRLEYDAVSIDGQVVPPPRRVEPAALEQAMIHQLQVIEHDVQTSLGMFKASLGQEQPQQSGKAILALTRESDTGTFHFQDNAACSITYGGRILVDLIPKVMDTATIARILGEDGQTLNVKLDPNQPESIRKIKTAEGIKSIHNLNVGTYDVIVTTGPSYNTKRMESAEVFTDLANSAKDPMSAAVMRYLAVKNSDFNGSDEAVDMLKKLLPPQVNPEMQGKPQIPPEVQAQMQQMQQAMQQMQQENQQLKSGAQETMAKVQVSAQEGQAKLQVSSQEAQAKLLLEKQVAMEKIALDRQVAEAKAQLARDEAQAKLSLEREVAVAEIGLEKLRISKEEEADPVAVEAKKEKETKSQEMADQKHEAMMGALSQLVGHISKPKTITAKSSAGHVITAEIK